MANIGKIPTFYLGEGEYMAKKNQFHGKKSFLTKESGNKFTVIENISHFHWRRFKGIVKMIFSFGIADVKDLLKERVIVVYVKKESSSATNKASKQGKKIAGAAHSGQGKPAPPKGNANAKFAPPPPPPFPSDLPPPPPSDLPPPPPSDLPPPPPNIDPKAAEKAAFLEQQCAEVKTTIKNTLDAMEKTQYIVTSGSDDDQLIKALGKVHAKASVVKAMLEKAATEDEIIDLYAGGQFEELAAAIGEFAPHFKGARDICLKNRSYRRDGRDMLIFIVQFMPRQGLFAENFAKILNSDKANNALGKIKQFNQEINKKFS